MSDNYSNTFYLAISPGKFSSLNARIQKKLPRMAANERCMKLTVTVPKALFGTPQLEAKITVPDTSVSAPVITPEVLNNIKQVMSQQLGVDMTISIVEHKEE